MTPEITSGIIYANLLPRSARDLTTPIAVATQYDISPRDEVYYCLATGNGCRFPCHLGKIIPSLGTKYSRTGNKPFPHWE